MISIDTMLFGFVAGLIGFKTAVLALAALLFVYGMTQHRKRRKPAAAPARKKRQRHNLDVYA